jgi:hypothetical protein
MALSPQARAEFVNAYTRVLVTAWSNEDYAQKLNTNPREALAEAGLNVPADAEIVLVRTIPEGTRDGGLDLQVELYEQGLSTNRFELHIPETPQVDTSELSEGDLEGIAAGDVNCCCTPCSCCT